MKKVKGISKWILLSLVSGLVAGAMGAMFFHALTLVTRLRSENGWLLFLLCFGGILTVKIYDTLKVSNLGTDSALDYVKNGKRVSPLLVPAVFSGTVLTHIFGGSAGREGAALQMGAGVSAFLSKRFKLSDEESRILTIGSMSAFFSALFGTPIAAAVFGMESVFSKKRTVKAFVPTFISSFTAFFIGKALLVEGEKFALTLPRFSFDLICKTLTLIVFATAICILFVYSLHKTKEIFKRYFKNGYVRIVVGAVLIILLTFIEGSRDYNGGGMEIVKRIFEFSNVKNEAFILKLIFTAITVGSGFKGGEIVPTFFIGATFGGMFALMLGISAPFGAALGMAALFSGATNCPVAATLICCEMFGFKGILYFALSSFITRFLSGKKRLYNV